MRLFGLFGKEGSNNINNSIKEILIISSDADTWQIAFRQYNNQGFIIETLQIFEKN